MENIALIFTSLFGLIGSVVAGWFVYNQKTKDRMTDMKIEKMRNENSERAALNNRHLANIHGAMYDVLYQLEADRCFIIQPHPEQRHLYLSVALEVDRKGVSAVKDIFQNVPISDMASFVKLMSSNLWLYYDDIGNQVEDKRVLSMMFLAGSKQIAIRQLNDVNNSWIGSIVFENINVKDFDKQSAMEAIKNCANMIQFILPPIQ